MKKKRYKNIEETVYYTTLKNKMKVILLYKPGFMEKDAYIITKFGHFDCLRKINVNGKNKKISWGIAHFLEHRMFSINDIDASDLFSKNGASCNAYTTYEKTCYYFTCSNKFYENLDILLEMMNNFSSTEKQIENEKSIIIQEANMYKEEPSFMVLNKLNKNAYYHHPIKMDIIGTTKTIKETTRDELEAVYNTFYDPSNLTLVCAGDINPDELEEYLNKNLLTSKNPKKIKPLKINEKDDIIKEHENLTLSTIDTPRVGLLFKLKNIRDINKKDKMYFSYNIICDYLFADSGKLSEKWLKDGIIKTLIDYSITSNIDLNNIILYNINDDPDKFINEVKKLFSSNDFNMTQEELDNIKKCHFGETIKAYETVNNLCSGYVYDLYSACSGEYFDEIKQIKELTLDDIKEAYQNICEAKICTVTLRGD